MMGALTVMLSGGNAGMGVGAGSSLETCVLADELTGMLKAFAQGVPVDDDNLAIDAIRDVGPGGGTFLGHPHTWMHFREHWQPSLLYRGRYEDWEAAGSKTVGDLTREKLQHIRRTHVPKPVPEAAKKRIAAIIERARGRAQVATPA
jgi:trimethylamine--corrinoid protein Co-methyltransferase